MEEDTKVYDCKEYFFHMLISVLFLQHNNWKNLL